MNDAASAKDARASAKDNRAFALDKNPNPKD
jgi:hypothetical protein